MIPTPLLDQLDTEQLRSLAARLLKRVEHLDTQLASLDKEVLHQKTRNQQLIHEIAQLKRHRFAKRSESFSPDQASLLDDLIETDLAAIEAELEILAPKPAQVAVRQQPKRTALPAEFPRTLIHHEPENTQCQCGCALKRIGEDVSEKLDYTLGVFSVERHIRGKWVCNNCETLIQEPVPAQVIDKGIPTAGLLAQVMIVKYADHFRCTARSKSSGEPVSQFLDQHWPVGSALAACNYSHWSMPCAKSCLSTTWCMSMIRRCRCLHRARRKSTVLMFGTTPRRHWLKSARWCTTSALVARANMPATFWVAGKASWSVMITVVTKPVLHLASLKSAA